MKTINKLTIIILMSIFIFLINTVNYKTSAYNWEQKGTTKTITGEDWRSEYYCANHSYEMDDSKNHTFKLTNRVNYYSDDTSDFKQKIGYLFYLASQDQNAQKSISYDKNKDGSIYKTYIKLNGYGTGKSGGYKRTKYQLVLWKLLYKDFSNDKKSCDKGEAPLYKTKVGKVSDNEWTPEAEALYSKIQKDFNNGTICKACTAHVGMASSELQIDTDQMAHFKIYSLSGKINKITINYEEFRNNRKKSNNDYK